MVVFGLPLVLAVGFSISAPVVAAISGMHRSCRRFLVARSSGERNLATSFHRGNR
jgi:hypothetical protein